ncbi:DUF4190 domain-containing protein [Streptomyces sp. NPDC053755]|uniref:DUF4190 domain-containing protein n=1 Tax=Streptomyces sp. NPDC053755 TaxID=3155815 RepID=UPI00343B76F2
MESLPPPQDSPPPRQDWPAPGTGPVHPGPYGPGPHGPGPFPPHLHGAPFPPGPGPHAAPPAVTSGLAIGSLVSGILCCLPPLGLILGLIALPRIRKRNQTGKGLAIAGIALSVTSCLLLTLGLVTGGFGKAWRSVEEGIEGASRSPSTFALRTGDCFDVDGDLEALDADVEVVDCAGAHEGEVTGTFLITGHTAWPGDGPVDGIAWDRCERIGHAYAMDSWALPEDVWTYYYVPTSSSWRAGDRNVTCALITDGAPVEGSLRNDETMLDADQVHFLKALNAVDTALFDEPDADADEDLAANTAWAAGVRTALTAASADLKGHHWPAESAASVAALVEELDKAAAKWGELAAAGDADAFGERYDTAYDLTIWGSEVEARTALGLADEGGSGGGEGGFGPEPGESV